MDDAELQQERSRLLKELVGNIPGFQHLQFVKDIIVSTNDGEESPVEDYNEDIPSFSTVRQQVIADMKKSHHGAAGGPIALDPANFKGENWEKTSGSDLCTTSVLSLFLDLQVPKNNMDHHVLPVGCQPDINTKRFTEPLNASPLNARLPLSCVVYKLVNHSDTSPSRPSEDSKTSLHQIQPMNVSDPSQFTVYGNQSAENLGVTDFDSHYKNLLGWNISDIIGDDAGKTPSKCFLALLCSINIAFDLQEEQGWKVLLKQLGAIVWKDKNLANLKALALSGLQVKQCAILAFSALINVKTAFLMGEGVMLGMKDFLLQDTINEFQVARPSALDIISPSTFGGNATFCPEVLKEVSHEMCSTLLENMSKTGSIKDFILQKALDDANSATASGGANTLTQTTLDIGSRSTSICGSAGTDPEDDYMRKLEIAQKRALVLLSDNKRHNPQVQAIFNGNTSNGTSMDDSAAALIKALMPKINIQYSPHSNNKAPSEFFWIVGLLTQWKEQSSAEALFSVLESDEKNHLLPSGTNGTGVTFKLYILTWDKIYKARKAVATVVLKEYEDRNGKKTRTGRRALLDKMARKLSPVILNTVKKHGLAVNIPFIWSEACPILYKQVRGGDKGENLDCLIELLLEMIVSTHPRASSLKYGTAWRSMVSQATLLDLDDSKLFAYNGEDMDLSKILSLLLQQEDFSSALNSILDAKKEERQTDTSTGKKKKASKKHNDSISEEERSSSGSEEDHTTTLALLPQMQSKKKTDAVKKHVSKFITAAAGTDGGGHESEHVDSAKWGDLGCFFEEELLAFLLRNANIERDEEIEPKVYEVFQMLSDCNEVRCEDEEVSRQDEEKLKKRIRELEELEEEENNNIMLENAEQKNKIVELESKNLRLSQGGKDGEKLKKRIRELEEEEQKVVKDQKAQIKEKAVKLQEALDSCDKLKKKYARLKSKTNGLEESTPKKQISPSSSSSGTEEKKTKKRTKNMILESKKKRQTKESNKKPKPNLKSYDSNNEQENTF